MSQPDPAPPSLRDYVQHKADCAKWPVYRGLNAKGDRHSELFEPDADCTCRLDEALAASAVSPSLRERAEQLQRVQDNLCTWSDEEQIEAMALIGDLLAAGAAHRAPQEELGEESVSTGGGDVVSGQRWERGDCTTDRGAPVSSPAVASDVARQQSPEGCTSETQGHHSTAGEGIKPPAPHDDDLASVLAFLSECGMTLESTVLNYIQSMAYKLRKLQREAALLPRAEGPPDGIRYDPEMDTWVARHTILTAGRTEEEAKTALASAIRMTADHWPPRRGEADPRAEARLLEHIASRLALFDSVTPLDDQAKWTIEARRNELKQLASLLRPTPGPTPAEPET